MQLLLVAGDSSLHQHTRHLVLGLRAVSQHSPAITDLLAGHVAFREVVAPEKISQFRASISSFLRLPAMIAFNMAG